MQPRRLTQVSCIALTVLCALLSGGHGTHAGAHSLVGTWLLELTSQGCQGGSDSPTNHALHTYLRDGSMIGSTNVTAFRSPSYGIWKRTHAQHFLATFTSFRFNADGTPVGKVEVTERITLGESPNHFTATAVVEILDVDDAVLFTLCVEETARRLTFDHD